MSKGRENKPHIGIFGRRNNGKSSFINALAGQDIAIVSDVPGTTADPVRKSMELPGIGPAILVDTAGIDDSGDLGTKRVNRSLAALRTVDMAILLITENIFGEFEENLVRSFQAQDVPFMVIHNKSDLYPLAPELKERLKRDFGLVPLEFCALHPSNVEEVIDTLRKVMPETAYTSRSLLGDVLKPGDLVLLITPIDTEAPEGRMILPQMQAVRDVLDNDCPVILVKENGLDELIRELKPRPKLAVTDSQVFEKANAAVPKDILLTSFSIMLARHKGDFEHYIEGTPKIGSLKDGDRVLILESCTHHVSCDDIGRYKIPAWMKKFTGKDLSFDVVAGLGDTPRPITDYALVVQCGGCVITRRQIIGRLKAAVDAGVPVTNYGMAIAWMHGIFERAVEPFVKA
ncbi:MAG: [FeFe] hydrogenase H-cluster maturation GTPase HydF [Bacteroides sp.]|jgi:[FeFe] hydrogenase H-cluster maturation GTPase HydF|nr:[FeFe] hydrogenase H-cluster maturation GTPase HydF [Bacteroides sp.]